jgi:hypothetical protein
MMKFISSNFMAMILLLFVLFFVGSCGDDGGNESNSYNDYGDSGNGSKDCGYEMRSITYCIDTGNDTEEWEKGCNDDAESCNSSDYDDYYDSWEGCSLRITYRNVHWVSSCESWVGDSSDSGNSGDSSDSGNSSDCECDYSGETMCSGLYLNECDGCSWQEYSCNEICEDNGYDYATECSFDSETDSDVCWCYKDAEEEVTIDLSITDKCDDGYSLYYRFFDITNYLAWPSMEEVYYTKNYNTKYTHNLLCNSGAKICIGGENGDSGDFFGLGINGDGSCDNCCIICSDGLSEEWTFTCN